jgi:hypothetical protein
MALVTIGRITVSGTVMDMSMVAGFLLIFYRRREMKIERNYCGAFRRDFHWAYVVDI